MEMNDMVTAGDVEASTSYYVLIGDERNQSMLMKRVASREQLLPIELAAQKPSIESCMDMQFLQAKESLLNVAQGDFNPMEISNSLHELVEDACNTIVEEPIISYDTMNCDEPEEEKPAPKKKSVTFANNNGNTHTNISNSASLYNQFTPVIKNSTSSSDRVITLQHPRTSAQQQQAKKRRIVHKID